MGDLAALMDASKRKGPYFAKDRAKAAGATSVRRKSKTDSQPPSTRRRLDSSKASR